MSASTVHWRAKALENAGQRLQRLRSDGVDPLVLRRNQREVLRQAAEFLADLLGDAACLELTAGEHPGRLVASFLAAWRPILSHHTEPLGVFWSMVTDELDRLPYGDEPSILTPAQRMRGQPDRPGEISFQRMRALEWAEYLKFTGHRPKHYQPAIALAFGADWDAIRHWRASVSAVIGTDFTTDRLQDAGKGYFIDPSRRSSILDGIWRDGSIYRTVIGMGHLEAEVFHAEWEKIARSLSVHPAVLEG